MRTSFIFNTAKIILERVKEVEKYEIKYKLELPPIYKSFIKTFDYKTFNSTEQMSYWNSKTFLVRNLNYE